MKARNVLEAMAFTLAMATTTLTMTMIGGPTAHAQEPEVRTYIVQPGDSAWSIAAQFYGTGDKYPLIYKYNSYVGKPPFLLKPGQVLKLPVLGAGPEAQVGWTKKDVKAKPPRALDWLEAREQMNLWRLYRVSTGDASAAHIVFEDTSDLKLRENALLVIYGSSASAARTARRDKTEVVLEQGTIQGGLAALDADAKGTRSLSVKTPSGNVDIYGTLAQIQADATASMVSVFEGRAAVSAQGATVDVPEGQGTVVKKGQKPQPARPLPQAPAWADGGGSALVATVAGRLATWDASWQPVAGAETFRVELGSDATFKQLLYDAEVGAGVTRLRLADLAPGRYAVRVSTRDADKLESKPGVARTVEVIGLSPARAITHGEDGVVEAVGFIRFDLPPNAKGRVRVERVAPDGSRVSVESDGVVRLGTAGLHELELIGDEARGRFAVRILGVKAALSAADMQAAPDPVDPWVVGRGDAPPAEVIVAVTDERGRPAVLPGLVVESSTGDSLKIEEIGPARYRAVIPAVGVDGPDRLAVRARWAGGELLVQELAVEPRRKKVVASRERETLPMTPHRVQRGLPQAHVSPRPETRIGLDTRLVDDEPGAGRFALELEAELKVGGLGLEAGLVFQDIRLQERGDSQSRLGDLSLGLRYPLFDTAAAVFAPYLKVGVPIGSGDSARLLSVEPGFLLRIEPVERFLFDFRVALVHANDFGDQSISNVGGLFALAWRPVDLLTMSLSAETVAGIDRDFFGHVAGFGLGFHFGDVRLGLAVGLGLGDDAQANLGAYFGRLVLDLGFFADSPDSPDSEGN